MEVRAVFGPQGRGGQHLRARHAGHEVRGHAVPGGPGPTAAAGDGAQEDHPPVLRARYRASPSTGPLQGASHSTGPWHCNPTIVKAKQAGTCGRGTKYHPRCQIPFTCSFLCDGK